MGKGFYRKIFFTGLLLFLSVHFLSCSASPPTTSPDYYKDPVVFVHGFAGRSRNFNTLKARLVANGWTEEYLFTIDYSDRFGCNKQNARELSVFVDSALAWTGAEKVDIVAHSMGGLSTRYFIKYLGGDGKVRDIVTLGSPHHGVYTAHIILPFTDIFSGAEQMAPGSNFLSSLNAVDETPGDDTKWTSIWSKADLVIRPPESSILRGAWNVHVEHVGHASLLLDKEQVFPVVKQALVGDGRNDD